MTDKNDKAAQRTDWAEDRTILANERTFASWMRTGMACIGVALGLRAVFSATDYPLIAKGVAELFILTALLIFVSAVRRSYVAQKRIDDHDASAQSHKNMVVTAALMALGAIATGAILWLL
ncbi:YidH family protein [Yoonia litorea]|uniref:Putative membrane protein n=1 Tax=Yoonia litorea TaxID=1123755 RepID=A0A1I6LNQ4_9RHOB|nr:DUF202 domain-containing protein [Yoonia litorea]SFS05085.1 putative membrane protein [Yoonia litorea]